MKKSLTILIVTICTILLTGCGVSKKLNCSVDMSSQLGLGGTATAIQDIEIDYKGNKINAIVVKMTVTYSDTLKDNMDQIYESIKNEYETTYGVINGVTVKMERTSETTIVATISMDYIHMTSADRKAAHFDVGNESYAVAKAELESANYTCK